MLTNNINMVWGSLIVEELIRCRVDTFVVCPGSRSTPLVAAVAENRLARAVVHTDERGAAFYALGYAKATGRPAAVITTSGTAVANCLPAVIEAAQSQTPLIILSADRPPELRDTGANQTIRQPGILGHYVRWEFDLPCPTTEIPAQFVLSRVDLMVRRAGHGTRGPVHLNCMFREPLSMRASGNELLSYFELLQTWLTSKKPWVELIVAESLPAAETYYALRNIVNQEKVAIIVGALRSPADRADLIYYLHKFNGVLFADIQAGLRLRSLRYVGHHDLLMASSDLMTKLRPELVVYIGERIVSKRLQETLARWSREGTFILRFGELDSGDPDHLATTLCSSPPGYLHHLLEILPRPTQRDYADQFETAFNQLHDLLLKELYSGKLTELAVAHSLCYSIEKEFDLFAASSMTIRLLEMVAVDMREETRIVSNRGASGIDGTIASACGFAAGAERPVVVFMGDQALLHDLNSLFFVRKSIQPMIVVLLNNNGGGIFEHLPIAEEKEMTEQYFVAPHGLRFADAARQFGIPYTCVTDLEEFTQKLGELFDAKRSAMLEVVVDRTTSAVQIRQIINAAKRLS